MIVIKFRMNTIAIITIRMKSAHGLDCLSIERFNAMNVGPNDIANRIRKAYIVSNLTMASDSDN